MSLAGHNVVVIGASDAITSLEKAYRDAGAQVTCGSTSGPSDGSHIPVDVSAYKSVAAVFSHAFKQHGAVDIVVACLAKGPSSKSASKGLPSLEEEIALIEGIPRLTGWIWRIGEHYLTLPSTGRKPVRAKQLVFVIDNPAPSTSLSPAHASAANAVLGIAKSVNVAASFHGYSVFTVCLDPFEAFKENTAACAEIIRLGTHAEPPAVETNGAYVVQQPGGGFKTLSPGSVGIRQSIGVQLFGARLGAAIWFRVKSKQAVTRATLALAALDTPGGPRGVLAGLLGVLVLVLWRRGACPAWLAMLAGWLAMTTALPARRAPAGRARA